MGLVKKTTTTVSSKGQITLPKAIRDGRGEAPAERSWSKKTQDRVLLRPASPFVPTKPKDVFGCLSQHGKHLSDKDIVKALHTTAKRSHA